MTASTTQSWFDINQRTLMTAVADVRMMLERHAASRSGSERPTAPPQGSGSAPAATGAEGDRETVPPIALDALCTLFGLTPFERNILLLCAGMELDSSFAGLCAAAQGDQRRCYPTFSLALAALPDAHWSALTPESPLRRLRLIELIPDSLLTISPLRIDEKVLHYLAGLHGQDERLAGIVALVRRCRGIAPSHRTAAEEITKAWDRSMNSAALPLVQLWGEDHGAKRSIASAACAAMGMNLSALDARDVPAGAGEQESFLCLWEREAVLGGSALFIDCDGSGNDEPSRVHAVVRMAERIQGAVILSSREPRIVPRRRILSIQVDRPTAGERRALWEQALGPEAARLDGRLDVLVSQFSLGSDAIDSAISEVNLRLAERASENEDPCGHEQKVGTERLFQEIWNACRVRSRPRMDDLARRLEPRAAWDDLVLPEQQKQVLREIAIHVRQRMKVYESWGFGAKSSRGLGISALFTGASGTGKTMAAEVLANELNLDLYQIDLSQVVSKYIGETEKNLRRIFDAAEEGGAILLFDEADALFGRRSEVKDSHDRYANIEVSYLLQRMEAYRGLAILTTNMKNALDTAFLRRIRFIVPFPFPDAAQRAEIWRRIFPGRTPTDELNADKLAQLAVAGGNIRNIALHAAFLAAEGGESVRMKHLLRAARGEYNKLEKTLTEGETGGWV